MNKIINIVLSGLLWRRYKFLLVSLILMVVTMIIVGQVHQDYLRYSELQNLPTYVGLSFAIKWLVWIALITTFLAANHFYNKYKQTQKELQQETNNSALAKLMKRVKSAGDTIKNKNKTDTDTTKKSDNKDITKNADNTSNTLDPFASIRQKDKLRSYADVIIDKKKS